MLYLIHKRITIYIVLWPERVYRFLLFICRLFLIQCSVCFQASFPVYMGILFRHNTIHRKEYPYMLYHKINKALLNFRIRQLPFLPCSTPPPLSSFRSKDSIHNYFHLVFLQSEYVDFCNLYHIHSFLRHIFSTRTHHQIHYPALLFRLLH